MVYFPSPALAPGPQGTPDAGLAVTILLAASRVDQVEPSASCAMEGGHAFLQRNGPIRQIADAEDGGLEAGGSQNAPLRHHNFYRRFCEIRVVQDSR